MGANSTTDAGTAPLCIEMVWRMDLQLKSGTLESSGVVGLQHTYAMLFDSQEISVDLFCTKGGLM